MRGQDTADRRGACDPAWGRCCREDVTRVADSRESARDAAALPRTELTRVPCPVKVAVSGAVTGLELT